MITLVEKFKIQFDEGCRECTFDIDPDSLNDFQKKLVEVVKSYLDCPVKCLVCQFKTMLALNGDGLNEEVLKKWGWAKLPE
jgi:hypothetical protein